MKSLSVIAASAALSLFAHAAAAECRFAVNFPFGSANVNAQDLPMIDSIASRFPAGPIQLAGHTDLVGSAAANQRLSERRVAAVKARLDRAGANPGAVVSAVGLGQTRPIEATTGPSQANRRVEIIVPGCTPEGLAAGPATGFGTTEGLLLGGAALAALLIANTSSTTTTAP